MDSNNHLVDFYKYCQICIHWEKEGGEEPCNKCLSIPARENSRKPEYFKEVKL